MIVVLEGIDGTGKTTVAKNLQDKYGFDYIKFPFSLNIDEVRHLPIIERTELFFDDMFKQCDLLRKYRENPGKNIVVDRYIPSLIAYNFHEFTDKTEQWKWFERLKYHLVKPDFTFLFITQDFEKTVGRIQKTNSIDFEGVDFFKKVQFRYFETIVGGWVNKIIDVDNKTVDEIIKEILKVSCPWLLKNNGLNYNFVGK